MIVLRTTTALPATALQDLSTLAAEHPGPHRLCVMAGAHRIELGPAWSFAASRELLAALGELGDVTAPTFPPQIH